MARVIAYWISTAVTAFVLLSGGLAYLLHVDAAVSGVTALGYPAYLVVILGTWKLLGVPAILIPGFARLKEWSYAGIAFDLSGATISHVFVGDSVAFLRHSRAAARGNPVLGAAPRRTRTANDH
jgi:hypothetical protein